MSSYASVYLSDGRPICSFRNGVDQLFFILFTRDDWVELSGPEAMRLIKHHYLNLEEKDAHVTGFRTRVGVLRDRLDVLGVPASAVASELERLAADRAEFLVRYRLSRGLSPAGAQSPLQAPQPLIPRQAGQVGEFLVRLSVKFATSGAVGPA